MFLKEEVAIVVGGGGVMCEGQVPSSMGRRLHNVQCTLLLRSCNYVEGHDDDIIQTSCHEKCKYMILSSSFTNPNAFALENLNFPAFRLQVGLSLELDVVAFANE